MKFAKRQTNPIFIEEENHHWKPHRPQLMNVLSIAGLTLGVVALVLLIVN